MKWINIYILLTLSAISGCNKVEVPKSQQAMKESIMKQDKQYNELNAEEKHIIIDKGTEEPFTGKFDKHFSNGVYTCKRCNALLYNSKDKFKSQCGWPSFDDEIKGAIKRVPDADGRRTEIVCAHCLGHLGHVFTGEGFTDKNIRHCVNSVSMNFQATENVKIGKAIFAGGCFWGVEYHLQKVTGVIGTRVGYTGGKKENPTYKEICSKTTEHVEAVEVTFDPVKVDFETLAKLFFEIHDPTQVDKQGPDIGKQYRSEIFHLSDEQKNTTEKLIKLLEEKGLNVATKVTEATTFWNAEKEHQDYYDKKGTLPYCHAYTKRF